MSTGTETATAGTNTGSFGSQVQNLFFDWARHKAIDLESNGAQQGADTANVQAAANKSALLSNTNPLGHTVAGIPIWGWAVGLVGAAVAFKVLR